jgi:hypothetical protein
MLARLSSRTQTRSQDSATRPPMRTLVSATGNQAALRRLALAPMHLSIGQLCSCSGGNRPAAPRLDIDEGRKSAPDTGTAPVELDDPAKGKGVPGKSAAPGGQAATCAEKPTIKDVSPAPTTVLGDSIIDFLANVKPQVGDPYTAPAETHDMELNGNNKVVKVNMTVTVSIKRPRWGGGRGSDKDNKLIQKAVDLIKDHEAHHKAIVEQMMQQAVCAALGKPGTDAQTTIDDYVCNKMARAQEDYDVRSGELKVVNGPDGQPNDVVTGPVATRPNYGCATQGAASP